MALTMVVAPGPVAAADPSVTVGSKTLSADRTAPIDPAGDTITVRGTGYDPAKGIYVAICAIPAGGGVPTPCGGGEDRSGASGSSSWITNDPPSCASGLTAPYGPGGSFQVQLRVSANLPGGLDCRQIACAVTTRNDHTRSSDRSQDVLLPLTFAAVAAPTSAPPPTTAPATTTTTAPPTTTTTAPVDVARPAPSTRPTDDGAGVTDGTRTVQLDSGEPLPVDGRPVVITGRGFDPDKSLDVEVCAVPPTGEPPTACATSAIAAGPAKAAAHVVAPLDPAAAATPPAGAGTLGPDGAFEVTVFAHHDLGDPAGTDCREVACAVVVRNDDRRPTDRSQELVVPIAFAAVTAGSTRDAPTADDEVALPDADLVADPSSSPALAVVLGGLVLAGAAAAVVVVARRRSTS
ncbi:MAG: hypothetical protein R2699_02090 [Acidimicrobiales bacterium]